MRSTWRSIAFPVGACAMAVLVAAFLVAKHFPAGGNDDSHITYWSAHALATYGEIVSYNGLRVEQSSSLTLVILLALAHVASGISIPTLGWILSLGFGAIGIALAYVVARKHAPRTAAWCPLLLGTWLPFLYWSSSGMEMTLVAALGGVLAVLLGSVIDGQAKGLRVPVLLAAALGLFALARPETPLELVAALGLVMASAMLAAFKQSNAERERSRRRALLVFVVMTLGVVLIAAVRYLVFGLLVPNSASAKTGAMSLSHGMSYLAKGMVLANVGLPVAAAIGAAVVASDAVAKRASASAVFMLGWGLASTGFVIGSGGDWMPGARLIAPLGLPLVFLSARAIELAHDRIGRWAHVLPGILVAFNVVNCDEFAGSRSNNSYTWERASLAGFIADESIANYSFSELANKAHRRDAKLLGTLMDVVRRAQPQPDKPLYIMSGQAGMVPYYVFKEFYGSVRFLDLYALTSPELLPCIPARARTYQVQGVRISAAYVIDHADEMDEKCGARAPDIVFSTGRFPDYLRERGYERTYQGPRDLEAFVAVEGTLADELRKRR